MARPTPLVSVVVATNRSGEYLGTALESVDRQSHTPVEVIVVDDGSADPGAIAAAASMVRGARVIRQAASGPSIARNRGVAAARGSLLAFLDDDDVWHPDRLRAAVEGLERVPEAVLAYCGMRTIDRNGRLLVPADQIAIAGRLDVARRTTGIMLPNSVIRADAFAAVGGFHSRVRLAEDLDLVLRLAEYGSFVFDARPLVDYRAHGGNTTRRHHDLVVAIDAVLRLHGRAAVERGDDALVAALDESRRKNARYAWWGAVRAARAELAARHPAGAVGEVAWALRTAPRGLADGLVRHVRPGSRA